MSDRAGAVLLHGAGSSPEFLTRAFPPAALGVTHLLALGEAHPTAMVQRLDREVTRLHNTGKRAVVGGVSVGSHAAARWAAGRIDPGGGAADDRDLLVLAMPAWIGPPGYLAELTHESARSIERWGVAGSLARIRHDLDAMPPNPTAEWILSELALAWPTYAEEELVAALEHAARSAGPSEEEMTTIGMRTLVLALTDDPLHPLDVAQRLAALIPRCTLVALSGTALRDDRSAFAKEAGRWMRSTESR